MKPTAQDAVEYLNRVAPERKWSHRDGMIFEEFEHEPILFAHAEELHWMKDKAIGARGTKLSTFEGAPMNVTNTDQQQLDSLLTSKWLCEVFTPKAEAEADAHPVEDKPKSKTERAKELVRANPTMSNKDLTTLFQKELGMTEAGARTYVYNARKAK